MTFSEYRSYQAPSGFRDELINGEVILSPSANRKHADLCTTLYDILKLKIAPEFVVRLDTTHHLGEKEGPRPDVFVINRERWIAADADGGYPAGSPELVVEVLSPSNGQKEMAIKRQLYLSDPHCLAVWEIDLATEHVTCYYQDAGPCTFGHSDLIPLPSKVGDGGVSVRAIFAGIVI